MHANTFAARAGRWSAQHRKKAIWGWIAFVVIAFVIGGAVGVKKPTEYVGPGDSGRAQQLALDHLPKDASESVLVQAPKGGTAHDAAVRRAVADTIAAVSGKPRVAEVKSPYAKGNESQIGKDGRSVLVTFKVRGDQEQTSKAIDPIVAAVTRVKAENHGVFVGEFGDASANKALSKSFSDDFKKAETLSLPITLVILVVAFGALVAAGIPLLLGLSAVLATLGLVALPSHLIPMDDTVSSVILLVGLAVGVDYTLFYLRREREEKRAGAGRFEAVHTAAATSGRAILVSGFTVMAAMAGMFLAGNRTFIEMGIGTILVVAVAMIGSITVVPAVLAWLGDRVDKGRVPLVHRLTRRGADEGRLWPAITGAVMRRPVLAAVSAATLLVVLAIPAFSMHTVTTGTKDLPRKLEVMKVYDRMQAAFPGGQIPAEVVVHAPDVTAPEVSTAIAQLRQRALQSGSMHAPISATVSPDRHVAIVSVPIDGDGADAASQASLRVLRDEVIPATVGRLAGADVHVTGMTAGSDDFNGLMRSRAPLVIAFVLALAFALLLVTFRSIVIPIKAIVLNLLSVGASYGVLVWVFQEGHGEKLLGFHSNGGITAWLPIFLFVILFGLSMDYHVFIISRIREAFDRGMKTEDAVSYGIRATAGTVTSAAIVMVAVFAIFATLSYLDFK
ncbi:MAG TPA: MMPL family transporter, partial [Solirubrobacteraceae bacterium]|nr:MMPL family transporter [Solirubrobacteraceae bacterium]